MSQLDQITQQYNSDEKDTMIAENFISYVLFKTEVTDIKVTEQDYKLVERRLLYSFAMIVFMVSFPFSVLQLGLGYDKPIDFQIQLFITITIGMIVFIVFIYWQWVKIPMQRLYMQNEKETHKFKRI